MVLAHPMPSRRATARAVMIALLRGAMLYRLRASSTAFAVQPSLPAMTSSSAPLSSRAISCHRRRSGQARGSGLRRGSCQAHGPPLTAGRLRGVPFPVRAPHCTAFTTTPSFPSGASLAGVATDRRNRGESHRRSCSGTARGSPRQRGPCGGRAWRRGLPLPRTHSPPCRHSQRFSARRLRSSHRPNPFCSDSTGVHEVGVRCTGCDLRTYGGAVDPMR